MWKGKCGAGLPDRPDAKSALAQVGWSRKENCSDLVEECTERRRADLMVMEGIADQGGGTWLQICPEDSDQNHTDTMVAI